MLKNQTQETRGRWPAGVVLEASRRWLTTRELTNDIAAAVGVSPSVFAEMRRANRELFGEREYRADDPTEEEIEARAIEVRSMRTRRDEPSSPDAMPPGRIRAYSFSRRDFSYSPISAW